MLNTKKLSLKFPDYNSMWLFKAKTKAINVSVEPRRNIITGLFEAGDIEMAVKEFNAVHPTDQRAEMAHV